MMGIWSTLGAATWVLVWAALVLGGIGGVVVFLRHRAAGAALLLGLFGVFAVSVINFGWSLSGWYPGDLVRSLASVSLAAVEAVALAAVLYGVFGGRVVAEDSP